MGLFGGDSSTTQQTTNNVTETSSGFSQVGGPAIDAASGGVVKYQPVTYKTDAGATKAALAANSAVTQAALKTNAQNQSTLLAAINANGKNSIAGQAQFVNAVKSLYGTAQQASAQQQAAYSQQLQSFAASQSTNNDQRLLTAVKIIAALAGIGLVANAMRKR